jgi:uncharacterized membrane protein
MKIETTKKLGIFGILLIFIEIPIAFLTLIPAFKGISSYGILRIIGIICILISLYHLANRYQTKTIYTNARTGAITAIIGTILSFLIGKTFSADSLIWLLPYMVIFAVFFSIAAFFVNRSLKELAARSGINDFESAGK